MRPDTWTDSDTSRDDLLADLFWESHRTAVPFRRAFLEQPDRSGPGPAAEFVGKRRELAFDILLLLHASASSPPFQVPVDFETWRRVVAPDAPRGEHSRLTVQRNLRWLRTHSLVAVSGPERSPTVHLLDERATGTPYVHPFASGESYFTLPHAYWTGGWDRVLGLPGKLVLLIARSLRPVDFLLPTRQAGEWYGVSPLTIQRGVRELREHGLLRTRRILKRAENAPTGYTHERRHTLVGPFERDSDGADVSAAGADEAELS